MLTYNQWGCVAFTWEQFHKQGLITLISNMHSEITLLRLLSHLPGSNGLIMIMFIVYEQSTQIGYQCKCQRSNSGSNDLIKAHFRAWHYRFSISSLYPDTTKLVVGILDSLCPSISVCDLIIRILSTPELCRFQWWFQMPWDLSMDK